MELTKEYFDEVIGGLASKKELAVIMVVAMFLPVNWRG